MFSFFKRNYLFFLTALFITLIGSFYLINKQESSFHAIVFTSIANQSDSSTQENEQASAYFAETIVGWFRNPVFLEKIYTKGKTQGSLSSHKQERQNLVIEIDAASEEKSKILANTTLNILENEIEKFNQDTKNNYQLLNLGITTYQNPLKNTVFILAALIGIFLITFFSILGIEAIQGKISLPLQVQNIFKKQTYLNFNPNNENDLQHMATLCLNSKKPILFAGIDFDHSDLTVKIAIKSNELEENLILIDGDLKEKKLHLNLGLSEMMQNLKGLTDRVKTEEQLSQYIHKALDGSLDFLAAGNGTKIILEDLAEQLEKHKTILIHTIFPQNFPLLNLEDCELFLFIKPGKSKLKTLKQIQILGIKKLKVFIL